MDRNEFVRAVYGGLATTPPTPAADEESLRHARAVGYDRAELATVPPAAVMGLACGNPVAAAFIATGQTVLDVGSGAGLDCLLAAAKVGPGGRVIGVDVSSEMIVRAQRNVAVSSFDNLEFRLGDVVQLPLANGEVDVALSNCVLNLVENRLVALREIARVLKPGGCFVFSDIMLRRPLPEAIREQPSFYAGCIGGAIAKDEYAKLLTAAGFAAFDVVMEQEIVVETEPSSIAHDPAAVALFDSIRDAIVSVTVCARTTEAFHDRLACS